MSDKLMPPGLWELRERPGKNPEIWSRNKPIGEVFTAYCEEGDAVLMASAPTLLKQRDLLVTVCRAMSAWFNGFSEDKDLVQWLEECPAISLDAALAEVEKANA